MRRVFALLTGALVLAVVAQFFLAASGAFDTAPADESFRPHRALGYAIVVFALLVTVVGALARLPGRLIGMTALVAGLGVVQGLIRTVAAAFDDGSTAGTLVFGLHAINALAIMAVSGAVARRARALLRAPAS
jgi:hypothetical protein